MTDHYREAERLIEGARMQPADLITLDDRMMLLAAAQVHATLAQATPPVPPVADLSEFATMTDLSDEEHAEFHAAATSMAGLSTSDEARLRDQIAFVDQERGRLQVQVSSLTGQLQDAQNSLEFVTEEWKRSRQNRENAWAEVDRLRAEVGDLLARAVVMHKDWREQVVDALPGVPVETVRRVINLIESWAPVSSPDSGKAEPRKADSAPFKVGDWVRTKVPAWSEPWQVQAISLARIDGTSATAKRLYRTEGLWYLAWDVERAASPESTEGASDAQ